MMRDESGMDLDWFWNEWIFSVTRLDQAVDSVSAREDGGSNVYLSSKATMIMPAELSLIFADGSHTTVRLPIEMWNLGPNFMYRVPEKKRVIGVEIDPRHALPDINRLNNVWPRQTSPPVR
jgi:hypothetical protein